MKKKYIGVIFKSIFNKFGNLKKNISDFLLLFYLKLNYLKLIFPQNIRIDWLLKILEFQLFGGIVWKISFSSIFFDSIFCMRQVRIRTIK